MSDSISDTIHAKLEPHLSSDTISSIWSQKNSWAEMKPIGSLDPKNSQLFGELQLVSNRCEKLAFAMDDLDDGPDEKSARTDVAAHPHKGKQSDQSCELDDEFPVGESDCQPTRPGETSAPPEDDEMDFLGALDSPSQAS